VIPEWRAGLEGKAVAQVSTRQPIEGSRNEGCSSTGLETEGLAELLERQSVVRRSWYEALAESEHALALLNVTGVDPAHALTAALREARLRVELAQLSAEIRSAWPEAAASPEGQAVDLSLDRSPNRLERARALVAHLDRKTTEPESRLQGPLQVTPPRPATPDFSARDNSTTSTAEERDNCDG